MSIRRQISKVFFVIVPFFKFILVRSILFLILPGIVYLFLEYSDSLTDEATTIIQERGNLDVMGFLILDLSRFLSTDFLKIIHYDVDIHFRVFEDKYIVKNGSSGSRYSE